MKKKTKKSIFKNKILIILLIVILILLIVINILEKRKQQQNEKFASSSSKYESIEEIVKHHESVYISEVRSRDKNYLVDIHLKFKFNTFENNESKQRFYENFIASLANFIGDNFRIIDEEKELIVEVIKNNEENNIYYYYLINGADNYFTIEKSKKLLTSKKDEKNSNIRVNSNILNQLINNNWNSDGINFGSKDSTFSKYDIYFDEGIEVREISDKIYNIVFTTKYNNSVINDIFPGEDFKQIISKMGEPTYGSEEYNQIGYKNNDIYVFFTNEEISIFRNEENNMTEFELLLKKYLNSEIEIKEFMNELTYLWDDYEEYRYSSDSIYINYPLHGIKIEMDSDNPLGIKIYGNCNITDEIKKLIEEGKITGCLDENLLYNTVKYKKEILDQYSYLSNLGIHEDENKIDSSLYYACVIDNYIFFISKNNEAPNRELKVKATSGLFITDTLYIYSCKKDGIYLYNTSTNEKSALITGDEEFELINYENQILKYDDKELKINME